MTRVQGANNMKKKILILITMIFILCGCTAEVNLDIDDMKLKENVNIDVYADENYKKNQLLTAFRKYIPVYEENAIVDTMPDQKEKGIIYYNRTEKDLGNGYRLSYNYNFNISNYHKARTVKEAFKSSIIQVNKKNKEILLSTDNSEILYFSQYPSLTKIKVNINTKYRVKENNADSVNNGTYTWNFDKNTKKNIYILLDTSEVKKEENAPKEDANAKKNNSKSTEENSFIEFINNHPIIVVITSVFIFIFAVILINKIFKNKY